MVELYGGSGGGGAFDYVQDPAPQDPKEGEEWYDTGNDSAFVYTGTEWIEQTITDHSKLSGIGASDHHSRPTGTSVVEETAGSFIDIGQGGRHPYGVLDRVQVEFNNQDAYGNSTGYSLTIENAQGQTWERNGTVGTSSNVVETVTVDGYIGRIEGGLGRAGTIYYRVDPVLTPYHSHNV